LKNKQLYGGAVWRGYMEGLYGEAIWRGYMEGLYGGAISLLKINYLIAE
jgi:hypothetical protein